MRGLALCLCTASHVSLVKNLSIAHEFTSYSLVLEGSYLVIVIAFLFIYLFVYLCSFQTFAHMMEVLEIVVVCDPSYRGIFEGLLYAFLDHN